MLYYRRWLFLVWICIEGNFIQGNDRSLWCSLATVVLPIIYETKLINMIKISQWTTWYCEILDSNPTSACWWEFASTSCILFVSVNIIVLYTCWVSLRRRCGKTSVLRNNAPEEASVERSYRTNLPVTHLVFYLRNLVVVPCSPGMEREFTSSKELALHRQGTWRNIRVSLAKWITDRQNNLERLFAKTRNGAMVGHP